MKRLLFVCVLALLFTCGTAAAELNTLTPAELDDGWILLFDGQTDFGWTAGSQANWKVADGAISVSEGDKGLLATTSEFADFELKVDFRAAKGTNSGVFLRTPLVPEDPTGDCYELNIAAPAVSPFATGSFVGRQKATAVADSDQWQTFTVKALGGHFTVWLGEQQVLDYVDPQPLARGRIGLQFNSGAVAFRNVKLKPLATGVDLQRPRPERLEGVSEPAERVFGHARGGDQRQERAGPTGVCRRVCRLRVAIGGHL